MRKEIKISIIFFCAALVALFLVELPSFLGFITRTDINEQKDYFFNDSYVHRVDLYFDDDNWYETLYSNHSSSEDPYEAGALIHEDYNFYPLGIRFKGASSFSYPTEKKSFKIDVNEFFEDCNIYDGYEECEDLSFYGLKKINFNNGYKDPSFMREKIFFDTAQKYFPISETVFIDLYVNDESMGLYTAVEQVDKEFTISYFGEADGNLFECERNSSDDEKTSSFGSNLAYHSDDVEDYYSYYELKFSEDDEVAWESLVHFIDVLNNYDEESFVREIETIADVDSFLYMLAFNNIFANYDSYTGSQHNYLLYEDASGFFHPIFWDGNESFGLFNMNAPSNQMTADIFYGDGVLESRFFNIESYRNRYIEIVKEILLNDFNIENMDSVINTHADLIRDFVYSDPQKNYSNEEFENALSGESTEMSLTNSGRPGRNSSSTSLFEFVQVRSKSIDEQLQNL